MLRNSFLLVLVVSSSLFAQGNQKIPNFVAAKNELREIFGPHGRTVYCGCAFNDREIDYSDCSYVPQKDMERAARVEWEHVVPASYFGQTFTEWSVGHPRCQKKGHPFRGRKCAQRTSKEFSMMEADLYNLLPSVGEANGIRENFPMGIVPGEPRKYGKCDYEVENRVIEPRPEVRGDIARIYFYMNQAYPDRVAMTKSDQTMFGEWDRSDPVDAFECLRYRMIKNIQENENPILAELCQQVPFELPEPPVEMPPVPN